MANDVHADMPSPDFDITRYFEGRTSAWGIFEDHFGRVRCRMKIEMIGRWRGESFVLNEKFSYDTVEMETRNWSIRPLGNRRFSATCSDVVGLAHGQSSSDGVVMRYRMRLKVGGHRVTVSFLDRTHRIDDEIVVNPATMSKLGFRLGELSLFFRREPA